MSLCHDYRQLIVCTTADTPVQVCTLNQKHILCMHTLTHSYVSTLMQVHTLKHTLQNLLICLLTWMNRQEAVLIIRVNLTPPLHLMMGSHGSTSGRTLTRRSCMDPTIAHRWHNGWTMGKMSNYIVEFPGLPLFIFQNIPL